MKLRLRQATRKERAEASQACNPLLVARVPGETEDDSPPSYLVLECDDGNGWAEVPIRWE